MRQRALEQLAVAVADARPLDVIYGLAAEEAAHVAEVTAGCVVRFRPDCLGMVVSSYGSGGDRADSIVALDDRSVYGDVARTGGAARSFSGRRVAVPIRVRGAVWGALVALADTDKPPDADLEERLGVFADLVGLAIRNADDHARLVSQASSDPLTGLLNHRAFQERYEIEFARAIRYGRPLSLLLLDLDYFKMINDAYGHEAGDEALMQVARLLSHDARPSDLMARIGGDEFAVALPETSAAGALLLADRCRASIRAAPVGSATHLTLSAGVCDLAHASTHAELLRLADGALYWAKSQGRDNAVAYSPDVVRELSDSDRADRLQRSHSLLALRSLAHAIDSKDRTERGHSERVALLVRRLAAASGWSPDRAARLAEAALIHDVGKIGVPEAILHKASSLTPAEYELMKAHAALSAQIAAEALSHEQTIWIRQHHERADGSGYPDGLEGDAISDGARLLALADSWDVMTTGRNYSSAKLPETALPECLSLAEAQFFPEACRALADIVADADVALSED